MTRSIVNRLLFILALSSAVACGHSSTSPTEPTSASVSAPAPSPSPSPVPAPPTGVTNGATISGTVLGAATTASSRIRALDNTTMTVSAGSATSSVDAGGRFSLHGVAPGHVDLHFAGAGADAHLGLDDVAEREDVEVTVHVSGSTVEVDNDDRETPDNKVELEGKVTAVDASARTLRVADKTVTVPAGTPIHHGGTAMELSAVHVGDRVHVRGTRTAAGVTATDVDVQNNGAGEPGPPASPEPGPGDGHGHDANVELNGTVSARSGACPAISFAVSSKTVTTNASTEFRNVSCAALANGDRVEVKATASSSGALVATRVEKDK